MLPVSGGGAFYIDPRNESGTIIIDRDSAVIGVTARNYSQFVPGDRKIALQNVDI